MVHGAGLNLKTLKTISSADASLRIAHQSENNHYLQYL